MLVVVVCVIFNLIVVVVGRNQVKMPEQSNDYRVVVFGAGGVGKSSLVLRFVKGTFRESYIPTVEDTYRQVSHQLSIFYRLLSISLIPFSTLLFVANFDI